MGPVSSSAVRLIGLLLTIGVSSGSVVLAQLRMTDKGPTFHSVQQIASIVGSDSDAAVVCRRRSLDCLNQRGHVP